MTTQKAVPCFTGLHAGCGTDSDNKLPEACAGPLEEAGFGETGTTTQPAPFMDVVALAIKPA